MTRTTDILGAAFVRRLTVVVLLVLGSWVHVGVVPAVAAAGAMPPAKQQMMAAAFAAGALPSPAPLPAGSADEQAETLARMVAAGDETSTPALVTAILAAGYIVSHGDGSVLKTSGGQGMVFQDWQIAAMARQFGQDRTIRLDRLTQTLQRFFPPFREIPFDTLLIADLRQDAAGDEPTRRFWARFITGLGKHAAEPYDLLNPSTAPADVTFDAIQTVLVMTRLAGDLAVLEKREAHVAAGQPRFQLAAYHMPPPKADDPPPCVTGSAGVFLDYNAIGVTFGFGKAVEALNGQFPRIEGYLGKTAIVNTILNVTKFLDAGAGNLQDSSVVGGVYLKGKKAEEQFSDAAGKSTIAVVGAPQGEDLSRKLVKNVERKVRAAAFIQAKTTNPADIDKDPSQWAGTISDYLGPIIAFLTGDKLGGAVGLTAETLYRSTWLSSDAFPFTVKDWQVCDDHWSGTVQAMTTGRFEESRDIYDLGPSKTTRRVRIEVTANAAGRDSTESVRFSDTGITDTSGSQFCASNARPPNAPYSARETTERSGGGSGPVEVSVEIDDATKKGTIEITPKFQYPLTMTTKKQIFQACPGVNKAGETRTLNSTGSGGIRITDVPAGTTNGVLAGSKTVTRLDGSQVVYTWHLTRCR
jgi:hypothetical protein